MIYTSTAHLPCGIEMIDALGLIALWLDDEAPESIREQIDAHYGHGGGWQPYRGFKLDLKTMALQHPGDPDMLPWVEAKLRDEVLLVYPHGWCLILQPDDSYSIARIG